MANKELVPPGLTYLADNIVTKKNILGAAKGDGSKWAKDLKLPKTADTIFFAGCGYQYSSELEALMSLIRGIDKTAISTEQIMRLAGVQKKIGVDVSGLYRKVMSRDRDSDFEVLTDTVKVLRKLGINIGYLAEDEPCCGGLLYYIGMQKEFAVNARQVTDTLKAKGVKRIISIVPSCTNTLRQLIPASLKESGIEVKHFSEVVAEKLPSLKLAYPSQVKVTYHDPCQLARTMKIIEEPRKILRAIKNIEFVEPKFTSGDCATCCGGGGGFEAVFPEMSQILATNRAKELTDTGAEIIVTNCPGCIMQLKTGLKELKIKNVEVLDLAQIIAMSMEV
jgi:dimethylglycine catabolism B